MTDRTQHVLDAIDGALADDELPDAMRWSPAPETVDDAPAPFDGTLVWQPPQRCEPAEPTARVVGHRPGCSIVHEYSYRPPSCQCGALDRAASRRRSPARLAYFEYSASDDDPGDSATWLRLAPAGTSPTAAGEGTDVLVDEAALMPWQVGVLAAVFGEQLQAVADVLSRLVAVSAEELEAVTRSFLPDVDRPPVDDQPAEDPRARALRLRQHRPTWPRRPAGEQARPPRRL